MSVHTTTPLDRVPGYLGRVLHEDGPIGTCFQVAPGLLVTAWHVLDCVEAGAVGASVRVDPLSGGGAFDAVVARVDPVHDLAVIRAQQALPQSVVGWERTDGQEYGTPLVITGAPEVSDVHEYRFLDARGTCEGGTVRDDAVPLGRARAQDVLPGMSGAPVRRAGDDKVIGVLSARYNSADGWLQHSIWIARTENLAPLLQGLATLEFTVPVLPTDGIDLTLHIGSDEVRLSGACLQPVTGTHRGVNETVLTALREIRQARATQGAHAAQDSATSDSEPVYRGDGTAQTTPVAAAVHRAGRLLTDAFLTGQVAEALADVLLQAEQEHKLVRLAVQADGGYGRLPWEILLHPVTGLALALRPYVTLYRRTTATAPPRLPGPLRILVAVSGPDDSAGQVLDYERELRNVLASVRSARAGHAHVKIVQFATTTAIRAALAQERFHILHLSGHGRPGELEVEHDDGTSRLVDADTFVTAAIPAGKMPPVIALSACHTAVDDGDRPSFAAGLAARGAAAVIATDTSITDIYATRFFARVYGDLTSQDSPDLLEAVAQARRTVHADLAGSSSPREQQVAAFEEWSTLTVLTATSRLPLLTLYNTTSGPSDHSDTSLMTADRGRTRLDGLIVRPEGEFVGRRREQRAWPRTLDATATAGLVLHGIGGIGKTTLAAELVLRMQHLRPAWIHTGLAGETSVDEFFTTVSDPFMPLPAPDASLQLPHTASPSGIALPPQQLTHLFHARRGDLAWQQRLNHLRKAIGDTPVLVSLDNFEDNLTPSTAAPSPASTGDLGTQRGDTAAASQDSGEMRITDPDLADLLAAWALDPGDSKLLITSRFPFTLPNHAHHSLQFEHLGPLSHAETLKLAWSLSALDRLTEPQLTRVWHLVGGHPRALEYLDALLNNSTARYPDITRRLTQALRKRQHAHPAVPAPNTNGTEAADDLRTGSRTLDARLAETATLAADDILLPDLIARLSATAHALLRHTAVYREPVDTNALLFQTSPDDDTAATTPASAQRILDILANAGIPLDQPVDLTTLPTDLQEQLAPHLAEARKLPTPPRAHPADLEQLLAQCAGTGLLHTNRQTGRHFVHRWTATELHRHNNDLQDLQQAHRNAAAFWRWHAAAWPQDPDADIHDHLEARHHLLQANDLQQAAEVTENSFALLRDRGSWNRARALITTSLTWLPVSSSRHPAWLHELGNLAFLQGEYEEARNLYEQSLKIKQRLGDQAGSANTYGQLGMLAQQQGEYEEARRLYEQSLKVFQRLGDQAGAAGTYHQLGILAQQQGEYQEARRLYEQALQTSQRLGNQAGSANTYGQLGMLAQQQGEYGEARRLYEQALKVFQRLGNQASSANIYGQLGILAQRTGDWEGATSWSGMALAILIRLQSPKVAPALQQLWECHGVLGAEQIAAILREQMDQEMVEAILEWLNNEEQIS
ncbi:tetratricopeptide repeat protein [Streptomyces sp. NPDC058464]|uniref:tetratricopeptide repeat protein n=1 Tax=Streptomyces sp. NPDC058464 TaxID=3346511 RepID=UPI00365E7ECB